MNSIRHTSTKENIMWDEIQDMPGEIFDIEKELSDIAKSK